MNVYAWAGRDMREPPKRLPYSGLKNRLVSAECLPSDVLRVAEAELERVVAAPGWYPKVIRLRRSLCMIDVCAARGGGLHSIQVALLQDHPFLRLLESWPHVPRSVKALYRKDVRLAHIRALDFWSVLEAKERAEAAWREYLKNRKVSA